MDSDLKRSMLEYYEQRAPEYEEIYTFEKGPASTSDPDVYRAEIQVLSELVARYCHGTLIDIACGTGFWLPHYARGCSAMTLVDQSESMLSICRRKAESSRVERNCEFCCVDVLRHGFPHGSYDCALVGFLLSHLTDEQTGAFFEALKAVLKPDGRFLVLDSIWSTEQARTRQKRGREQRILNDGRRFDIYKRYFDASDLEKMQSQYGLYLPVVHQGHVFIGGIGRFI